MSLRIFKEKCCLCSNILQKAGWTIEECDFGGVLTLCVIYEYSEDSDTSGMSSDGHAHDSNRTQSHSQSQQVNLSTDVNWDSGSVSATDSHWDVSDNTDLWDDPFPNLNVDVEHATNPAASSTKSDATDVWEETSNNFMLNVDNTSSDLWQQAYSSEFSANTSKSSATDSIPTDYTQDGPSISDHVTSVDKKIELLFDSGYQVSSSSIELSPELLKDWLAEDKAVAAAAEDATKKPEPPECIKTCKSHNPCRKSDEYSNKDYPDAMKSDGYIMARQNGRSRSEEAPVRPSFRIAVMPPVPPLVFPAVVENGDLANNNRDREGNNYQAAEQLPDDNALPRAEHWDEHNAVPVLPGYEYRPLPEAEAVPIAAAAADEYDVGSGSSLEDASREALFDPNSELSLGDMLQDGHGQIAIRVPLPIVQSFHTVATHPVAFPEWLLQLLNTAPEHQQQQSPNAGDTPAHFYSQGDGVGIHPSTDLSDDDDSDSSSSGTSSDEASAATAATAAAVPIQVQMVTPSASDNTSSTFSASTYHDAIDDADESRTSYSATATQHSATAPTDHTKNDTK